VKKYYIYPIIKNNHKMNKTIEAYHKLIQEYSGKGEKEIAQMYTRCISEELGGKGSGPYVTEKGLFHFHFNWKGGGYNSAWGRTKAEALKEVKARFGIGYTPDETTFKVYTNAEEKRHDRDQYLMWV
jgi:hypothetical protein